MAIDGTFQQFAIVADVVVFIARLVWRRRIQVPVLPDLWPAVQTAFHRMSGQQLGDPRVKSLFAERISEGEKFGQGSVAARRSNSAVRQDVYGRRCEKQ